MKKLTLWISLLLIVSAGVMSAEEIRWIPAAASNPGEAGTMWMTELWVMSRVQDGPIDVHIAFLPDAEGTVNPSEVTVEIPASRSVLIEDVVGSLFNENRPGALRLRSDFAFEAQSRTFNDGGSGGSFGQGIPALQDERGEVGWVLLGAANHLGADGVRSNIGLLNISDESDDVVVFLLDQATGEMIGGMTRVEVGGHGWTQFDVFEMMDSADQEVDNATVLVVGNSAIRGYLSRIDNRSGDGTFILPVAAESTYSIPANWEVTMTVYPSAFVTVDTLVYTGEGGEDVTVVNPEYGWTTTVNLMSPTEFCYVLSGSTDTNNPGSVKIEVATTREGELGSGHTTLRGFLAGESVEMDDCFDLP